ncbi:MAG: response regulator transcription factor [Clostridia bacterium]|nr:response regulator transcription factor [Clostridia bacterium]
MAERILIVEDEEKIARFVELELLHEGYRVDKSPDGRDGLEKMESGQYDLVLLDIMMPGLNGLEVLRRARRTVDTPVIMLTARDAVMDKVAGLDMGAEDYITKPFEIEELLARIRACLRKAGRRAAASHVWSAGALSLDADRHTVTYDGSAVDLTHREFTLLQILLENKGIVMTRSALLEHVWGYDYMGETNIVDVYIRYLRSKIDDVYHVKLLHTVRGVGYVLRDNG